MGPMRQNKKTREGTQGLGDLALPRSRAVRHRGESYDTTLSGAPAKSSSRHPYKDLLTQYRRMAEEALSKERVPFNYREQVKEYFKSLEQ